MKTNIKAYQLIEKGLSAKTVSKLTESQINVLHKKLVSEVTMVSAGDSSTIQKLKAEKKPFEVYEKKGDVKEDDDTDLVQQDLTQKITGQKPPEDQSDETNDGEDDDTNPKNKNLGSVGITESKKKEQNPWAICTAQLGKEFGSRERSQWNAKEMNKYERCVKDVKKSLKEGKNPVSLFLENEIMKIVERNLPPRITKGDLMKYLEEQGPATAPTKPKEKPGTKERPGPTKPKIRPGKNPHPGEKEAPRAGKQDISPEEAKDKVIKSITSLLKHGK